MVTVREVVVAAVDLGVRSGQVVVGRVGPAGVRVEVVHRFPLGTGDDGGGRVLREVHDGLRRAAPHLPSSVGVDGPGGAHGLLAGERLLRDPFAVDSFADEPVALAADVLHGRASLHHPDAILVRRLLADGALLDEADTLLLLPDLVGHRLAGARVAERTNAGTTGLLALRTGTWDSTLCARLGVPRDLLPPLVEPGQRLGPLLTHVRAATGLPGGAELVAVASNDVASAVAGTPLSVEGAACLSLGAPDVVAVEVAAPLPPGPPRVAGLAQAPGVDGTVLLHRSLTGSSLLSRLATAWRRGNRAVDLGALLEAAAALPDRVVAELPTLDLTDPALTGTGDVPGDLAAWLRARDEPVPGDPVTTVRAVCEGLAAAYARVLADLARVTGRDVPVVHVTGAGSRHALLCDLLAARTGVPVVAGPADAAALGNVLVQARTHGVLGEAADLGDLRSLVASAHPLRTHRPAPRPAPRRPAVAGR